MKKIAKEPDSWGQNVIYVEECDKYEYEIQPDMPLLNYKEKQKSRASIHKTNQFANSRICDIIK